jgi:hypothetical protein
MPLFLVGSAKVFSARMECKKPLQIWGMRAGFSTAISVFVIPAFVTAGAASLAAAAKWSILGEPGQHPGALVHLARLAIIYRDTGKAVDGRLELLAALAMLADEPVDRHDRSVVAGVGIGPGQHIGWYGRLCSVGHYRLDYVGIGAVDTVGPDRC